MSLSLTPDAIPKGYSESGERLVAGIVPISESGDKVLLISSTRRSAWVLPKGGWELDEATEEDAATREAWEEAGIIVKGLKDLGLVNDKRTSDETTPEAPRAAYRFLEAVVVEQKDTFPEMEKRERKWMTYEEAHAALKGRPELLDALSRCSVKRA